MWRVLLIVVLAVTAPVDAMAAAHDSGCASLLACLFGGTRTTGVLARETVAYPDAAKYQPGSIIVSTPERRLYFVLSGGKAVSYPVGVGKEGYTWSGTSRVVRKAQWPSWSPPAEMIARARAEGRFLPNELDGGPNNPLGARALYIGGTLYRIHGTNQDASIGHAVSSGCIRMRNADVIDLYKRVKIGAPVYVFQ